MRVFRVGIFGMMVVMVVMMVMPVTVVVMVMVMVVIMVVVMMPHIQAAFTGAEGVTQLAICHV